MESCERRRPRHRLRQKQRQKQRQRPRLLQRRLLPKKLLPRLRYEQYVFYSIEPLYALKRALLEPY
jgi:hypothetical protein